MLNPFQYSLNYAERQRKLYRLNKFDNEKLPDGVLLPGIDAPISRQGDSFHTSLDSANPHSDTRNYMDFIDLTGRRLGNWWTNTHRSFTLLPTKSPKSTPKIDHIHVTIEEKERVSPNSDQRKERAAIVTKEIVFPDRKDTLTVDGTTNTLRLTETLPQGISKTIFQTNLSLPMTSESRRKNEDFLRGYLKSGTELPAEPS